MYAIDVIEPSGNRIELCRVTTNPEAIAEGARRKRISTVINGRRTSLRRYKFVAIREISE